MGWSMTTPISRSWLKVNRFVVKRMMLDVRRREGDMSGKNSRCLCSVCWTDSLETTNGDLQQSAGTNQISSMPRCRRCPSIGQIQIDQSMERSRKWSERIVRSWHQVLSLGCSYHRCCQWSERQCSLSVHLRQILQHTRQEQPGQHRSMDLFMCCSLSNVHFRMLLRRIFQVWWMRSGWFTASLNITTPPNEWPRCSSKSPIKWSIPANVTSRMAAHVCGIFQSKEDLLTWCPGKSHPDQRVCFPSDKIWSAGSTRARNWTKNIRLISTRPKENCKNQPMNDNGISGKRIAKTVSR